MSGHFEVYRDRGGTYRWRLKAANHEVVAVGEAHTRRTDAHRAIAALLAAVGAPGVLTASAPPWGSVPIVDIDQEDE